MLPLPLLLVHIKGKCFHFNLLISAWQAWNHPSIYGRFYHCLVTLVPCDSALSEWLLFTWYFKVTSNYILTSFVGDRDSFSALQWAYFGKGRHVKYLCNNGPFLYKQLYCTLLSHTHIHTGPMDLSPVPPFLQRWETDLCLGNSTKPLECHRSLETQQ